MKITAKAIQMTRTLTVLAAGAWMLVAVAPGSASADVCSQGVGIPPFLSAGAKPNLLFAIDNSGSMLDLAYTDKAAHTSTAGTTYQNTCFDEKYSYTDDGTAIDAEKEYAGYFDADTWYLWVEPLAWQTATAYAVDAIVSANGRLYRATTAGTSIGTAIDDDTAVTWEELGPNILNVWDNTQTYSTGDIVIYKGMLYKATAGVTPGGSETLFDDRDASDNLLWNRLDEGYFEEQSSEPCASPSYYYLNDPDGTAERKDLKITFDNTAAPTAVTCFGARGNVLNWLSASKFDIEKQVLTGGKFYGGYEARDNTGEVDNTDFTDIG